MIELGFVIALSYQQNLISWKTDGRLLVLQIAFIQYVFIHSTMDASQTTVSFPKPCDVHLTSFHLGLPRGGVSLRSPFWFPWSIYSWISPTDILAFRFYLFVPSLCHEVKLSFQFIFVVTIRFNVIKLGIIPWSTLISHFPPLLI